MQPLVAQINKTEDTEGIFDKVNSDNAQNQILDEIVKELANLRQTVAEQQKTINQLQAELAQTRMSSNSGTNNLAAITTTTNPTNINLNRRRVLKGLAAGLAIGTATTIALARGEKNAEAKLTINPLASIGAIVTPPGAAPYTGQPLEPLNNYGIVGISDKTAFNLNKLPEVASCGVFGYTSSGAGVYGKAADGWGVKGEGSTTGFGVSGTAAGNGTGVAGGSETGIGVLALSGIGIPFQIAPSPTPPTLQAGDTGSFYVNSTDSKFYFSINGVWKAVATLP